MKVLLGQSIIIYVLIKSVRNDTSCGSFSSQLRSQCNCTSLDSAKDVCSWTKEKIIFVKTPQEVFINVQLPNLAECGSGDYEVKLYVNENIKTPENCLQNLSERWKIHSKIEYKVFDFSQCTSCTKITNSTSTATFEYLFSGCYILNINDKKHSIYESHSTFITTGYQKQLFKFSDNVKVLKPQITENKETEIIIKLNSKDFIKPPSISTCLTEVACKTNCIKLKATSQVNRVDTISNKYEETFTSCNSSSNIIQNCMYTEDIHDKFYECKYKELKPGRYKFEFEFLDEYTRCNDYSLWDLCAWPVLVFNVSMPKNTTNFSEPAEDTDLSYTIVFTTMAIIFFLCSSVLLYKKCHGFKYNSQTTLKPLYGSKEDIPLKPQEILIVYARDSELFKKMIMSFRLLLNSIDNDIFVHDININNESICVDPQTWIMNKISDANTKVIVFLNNCGIVYYENQPKIAYQSPNWQDDLFVYAIKQLKNSRSRTYTNLLVVELASIFYNTAVFDDLNPETRYIMPNNIEQLLESIFPNARDYHESFLKNFVDYCDKYNKFCEDNLDYVEDILKLN